MQPPHLSRRALLSGGGAAAAALGLGGVAGAAEPAMLSGLAPGTLPSAAALQREVRLMVELGPRLPGSTPHNAFVDSLAGGFRSAGLRVTRDRHHFTRWAVHAKGLEILEGSRAGSVPVASYYSYSGKTPPAGLVAPLVYAGPLPVPPAAATLLDLSTAPTQVAAFAAELTAAVEALIAGVPGGIRGKVVLLEAPIAPLPLGTVYPLLTYAHDPGHTLSPTDDFKRAWTTLLTLPILAPLRAAGAAGVVFSLDASPANAKGQYTPFIWEYQDLPALIVDRRAGAVLRQAASTSPRVRLTLDASLTPDTPSDSLVAVLPGSSTTREALIVHTHTDGQNAFEENAGIALVALARHFSRGGRSPLRRTLVFSCVSGHFAAELPETSGFIKDHPDLVDRAAAQLTLEHLGSTEWVDDETGYHPTGKVEPAFIFHSLTPIAKAGVDSLRAADLRRTLLLKPIGPFFFGVGAALHAAGVPSLAYISSPNYLLALQGKTGHLDKFSAPRMRREIAWSVDVLKRLDTMPAGVLKLGDSTLYDALPLPSLP
jgi:hypothetical protein